MANEEQREGSGEVRTAWRMGVDDRELEKDE